MADDSATTAPPVRRAASDAEHEGATKRARIDATVCKHGGMCTRYGATNAHRTLGPGVDAFFTRPTVLARIAEEVRALVKSDWTFVDFSCGTNEFAPALGCSFYSFDASPAALTTNFTCKDWFAVDARDFGSPPCDRLAIGLNPPFGYQASLARKFVEHALKFRPQVLALIIPSQSRWSVVGYTAHTQRQLATDSFYDPKTGATHRDITSKFLLLTKDSGEGVGRVESFKAARQIPLRGVTLTRTWRESSYPLFVVRRSGRYCGQQFYCATADDKDAWAYVSRGEVTHGRTYEGVHMVGSECFLKAYFDPSVRGVTLDRLIALAKHMCANPEPGCELRQPHTTNTGYVRTMLSQWFHE